MAFLSKEPASRASIAKAIGHKAVTRSLRQAISDLMQVGLVEYTLPEKPNSRLQRYRTKLTNTPTETGKQRKSKSPPSAKEG